MKTYKLFSLTILLSVVLYSCNKADEPDTSNNSFEFELEPVNELTIPADGNTQLKINVTSSSEVKENVTLSITGLTNGFSYDLSETEGTPDFTSKFKLQCNFPEEGTYTGTVNATSESGITKSSNFNVVVTESKNCASRMAGKYINVNTGGEVELLYDNSKSNGLILKNIYVDVALTLDCKRKTILINNKGYIPQSGNVAIEYSGDGTFEPMDIIKFSYEEKIIRPSSAPPYTPYITKTNYSYNLKRAE